ncbi:MAG: carboxylating nicotinate-nucleotide diphosphorylase, partial [Bacteroidales bacterium]|nr:carboxylating nicotinate-nucleotide diphosphorylase [Bacteroidales bacterium]
IIAGILIAEKIFSKVDKSLSFSALMKDGDNGHSGDTGFIVEGNAISILTAERTVLNFMQRMTGIATYTNKLVNRIENYNSIILDTRKTTPLLRELEKYAVRTGGAQNHRMGLYDMIMIKDNHIDFAGGISQAIVMANNFLRSTGRNLKIEIEVRSLYELKEVLDIGKIDRIMLDNFTPDDLKKALRIIDNKYETEASGGINEKTIEEYAATGVDFISIGSLTHHIKSTDLSLKAF